MTVTRQEKFDRQLAQLKGYAFGLHDLCSTEFPEGEPLDPRVTGQSWEYPLKVLADQIDNILASFDLVQEALGTPRTHTRHYHFLHGKCTCCGK